MRESGRFGERTGPVRIPVVVHVVYNTDAQNISRSRSRASSPLSTPTTRSTNPDIAVGAAPFKDRVGDALVSSSWRSAAPTGRATTGITRTKTRRDRVPLRRTQGRGGEVHGPRRARRLAARQLPEPVGVPARAADLLGYASFPGEDPGLDGVVINYHRLRHDAEPREPPFDKGRTATHEIGHWLNLFHIWGDDRGACTGSDQVRDTPNQARRKRQCPTFPHRPAATRATGDMFMNYMDYTDDACMFMFTKGQVGAWRRRSTAPRLALTTSHGPDAGPERALGLRSVSTLSSRSGSAGARARPPRRPSGPRSGGRDCFQVPATSTLPSPRAIA